MSVNVTLTLPETIIHKIDNERGDVNRSKYVLRLLERAYQEKIQQTIQKAVSQSVDRSAEIVQAKTTLEGGI